ncbi:unknown protein [Desulfotalea psychrophila LSv54]|uniref:Uncharacterized protein n=1 Tax=Desulfotalea psychrophila (strain LSv54 / DSM 12343) TaxID=177439 RepID=Q6ARB1_DESPS|nr:unknown protein [Desulfotalea psychrophila LSv54]
MEADCIVIYKKYVCYLCLLCIDLPHSQKGGIAGRGGFSGASVCCSCGLVQMVGVLFVR